MKTAIALIFDHFRGGGSRVKGICRCYRKNLNDDKLSRKCKKLILGKKLSKKQIREMVIRFDVLHHQKHIYEQTVSTIEPFCPWCGCTETRSTGNMVEYPELWERVYCLRCGKLVEEADNSTYQHVLEWIISGDNEVGNRLNSLKYLWLHGNNG